MGTTTPQYERLVAAAIRDIDALQKRIFPTNPNRSIYAVASPSEIKGRFVKMRAKIRSIYEDHLFDDTRFETIDREVFRPIEDAAQLDYGTFPALLAGLRMTLRKLLSKQARTAGIVKGLKQPFIWENILLTLRGETVLVHQNDTKLGEYELSALGIPKKKKSSREGGNVRDLFYCLFIKNEAMTHTKMLRFDNNANQKNKSNLSKVLKNAFGTNINPFRMDDHSKLYVPLFQVSLGDDLRINDHALGKTYHDGVIADENEDEY